jgi:hypothetical protein
MRLLCAAALSLSVGLWFAFAADPKTDRATRLADLKKKFEEENKELTAKLQKAESAVEARAAQAEMRELALITAGKVLTVAEGGPKDETGFEAAAFIVQISGRTGASGPDIEKAVGIIAEHHVNNKQVKDFLIPAMRMGEAGQKLLKAVGEKSTEKDAKGLALFLRGYMVAQSIDDEEDEKKLAALVKEATDLLEQAAKTAPDVTVGNSKQTIAKFAAGEVEGLKSVLSLGVGKPAPEVFSKTLDDKEVKLSSLKGKVVLLDIWRRGAARARR